MRTNLFSIVLVLAACIVIAGCCSRTASPVIKQVNDSQEENSFFPYLGIPGIVPV